MMKTQIDLEPSIYVNWCQYARIKHSQCANTLEQKKEIEAENVTLSPQGSPFIGTPHIFLHRSQQQSDYEMVIPNF